jgi:hypothetical protein
MTLLGFEAPEEDVIRQQGHIWTSLRNTAMAMAINSKNKAKQYFFDFCFFRIFSCLLFLLYIVFTFS